MVNILQILVATNIGTNQQLLKFASQSKFSLVQSFSSKCTGCRVMSYSIERRTKKANIQFGVLESDDAQAFGKKFYFGKIPSFYIVDENGEVVGDPYIGINTPVVVGLIEEVKKRNSI